MNGEALAVLAAFAKGLEDEEAGAALVDPKILPWGLVLLLVAAALKENEVDFGGFAILERWLYSVLDIYTDANRVSHAKFVWFQFSVHTCAEKLENATE